MINNPSVLGSLPPAAPGQVWAYLLEEPRPPVPPPQTDGKTIPSLPSTPPAAAVDATPVFTFLANPESLEWSRQANYAKGSTALTSVQSLQYYNSEGRSLRIKDLLLETWHSRRSIRPILEQLQMLLVPDPRSPVLHPKVLGFVWGTQRFTPCVLTEVSWRETAWLSGEPASARLDLTLIEIPPADFDPVSRIYREQQPEKSSSLTTPLTDRQREEARRLAIAYLRQNQQEWTPEVAALITSGRYRLESDAATGDVFMVGADGKRIGRILQYDGRNAATSGEITTVPTRPGVTLPNEIQFSTVQNATAGN